jgi:AraC family transcriptional activator of pobA
MSQSTKKTIENGLLPIHSLSDESKQINILPLDHTNPYDFKREHRHTYFEIMLIENGGCNQLIDFKNYEGSNFSCYIICPQQIHLMNRNDATGTVIQFTEYRINSPELRAGLRQLAFYENAAIVFEKQIEFFNELQMILNVLSNYLSKNNATNNSLVTHLLEAFVSLVLENSCLNTDSKKHLDKKLLIDFYQLLEMNYSNNVGVQFYIEQLNTTEKKLSETSKKHTGLSPLQVIHTRILLEAKRMLLFEDTTHKEMAYNLGFDSPASFSSFIKSKTGLSPSELSIQLAEIHK